MKEQWIMTLKSIQYDENEASESTLDTEIEYYKTPEGERIIAYEESEATGMEGSDMQLRIAKDGRVSIVRTGGYQTHLVVQKGKKHFCHYETPFGFFAVGVSAKWIRNELTDEGGKLAMRYTVDANTTLLSDNEIRIDVRKMKNQEANT